MADSGAEQKIRNIVEKTTSFTLNHEELDLIQCAKPTVLGGGGETKTDIYILAYSRKNDKNKEIKISYKKPTFSFVENKIKKHRAKTIYGDNWSKIIQSQIKEIQINFLKKPLVYFEKCGRIEKGSVTLGWRYEMEYNGSRSLGVKIKHNIASQVWKNKNAENRYVHGIINGKEIPFSGMPNYCLTMNPDDIKTSDDIFQNLISIDELIKKSGNITSAFLAQNYRTEKQKQEGNKRNLAVWINWKVEEGKLAGEYVFDKPLEMESGKAFQNLVECLVNLGYNINDENFNIGMIKDSIHSSVRTFP